MEVENLNTINLRIYWIRHGYSCANLLKDKGSSGGLDLLKNLFTTVNFKDSRGLLAPDSKLTDKTLDNICKITKDSYLSDIKKSHLLCCSELTRSVETAMLLFRNLRTKTLNVIPYISEKRVLNGLMGDDDNLPSTLEKLKSNIEDLNEYYNRNLKTKCDNLKLPNVDFEIIEHFRGIGGVPTEPSFEDFLERVIPYIMQTHLEHTTGTIDLILSIVSHSHFISEITGLKDIGNLDIVLQKLHLKYNIDQLGKINIDRQAGKLYHAVPIGSDIRFGEQDVVRCNRRFNSDKSACTWDITENGKVEINNSNANESVNRCGDKVVEKIISKTKDNSTQSTYVAPIFDTVVGGGKKRIIKLDFFNYY